jgi:hypothetical protein
MTDTKSWSNFHGELYKKYVEEGAPISEEEAISLYDVLIRDIKLTISARNYNAMNLKEKLLISTDDLTYYLRKHNNWAKRKNWSPKLTVLMRARGYYR